MLTIPTLILTSDTNRASPLRGGGGGGGRGRERGRDHQTSNNIRDQTRAGSTVLVMVDAVQL